MFFEAGPAPRNARVIYDRKHSAASELAFEDAPWEALVAVAGKPVSYDLNYRATLMTTEEARAMLAAVAPHLELLVVAERDARAVLGFAEEAERLAEAIAARYGVPLVGLTRGPTAHGLDPGAACPGRARKRVKTSHLGVKESALGRRRPGPKTLTVRPSPPIRPQFLEMDAILDPRAAARRACLWRGWKRILQCPGAAN